FPVENTGKARKFGLGRRNGVSRGAPVSRRTATRGGPDKTSKSRGGGNPVSRSDVQSKETRSGQVYISQLAVRPASNRDEPWSCSSTRGVHKSVTMGVEPGSLIHRTAPKR